MTTKHAPTYSVLKMQFFAPKFLRNQINQDYLTVTVTVKLQHFYNENSTNTKRLH